MAKRLVVLAILLGTWAAGCCPLKGTSMCPCSDSPNLGKVRHVVLFKFKDTATKEQIKAVEDAFRGLPAKIDGIRDFEWGTDISVESKAAGFTHCFLVTFDTPEARDAYLPHPDHKAFGKVLRPIFDKVLVFDYVAKD